MKAYLLAGVIALIVSVAVVSVAPKVQQLAGDFPGGIVPSQLFNVNTALGTMTPVGSLAYAGPIASAQFTAFPSAPCFSSDSKGNVTTSTCPTGVGSLANNTAAGGIDFSAASGTNLTAVLHSLAITQFTGTVVNSTGTWQGFSPAGFAQVVSPPTKSTSTCTAGQVAASATAIYYCVSTNLWAQALATTTW